MSRSASVETPTRRRRALSLSRLCTGSVENRIETTAMTTVYSRVASHQPAHAALNLDRITGELLADPGTLGLLFESLVVRDPRIYSRAQQGEVYCFRDNVGLEAGAIIERHDGAWIAVEAKLSPSAASVDRAARSLLRLRSKVAALRWFTTPSRYEIDIVLGGVRHEYGMALDDDRVVQEWAYQYPKGRARLLFDRQGDDIHLGTAERSRSRVPTAQSIDTLGQRLYRQAIGVGLVVGTPPLMLCPRFGARSVKVGRQHFTRVVRGLVSHRLSFVSSHLSPVAA